MKTLALILMGLLMAPSELWAQPHWNWTPAHRPGYWRQYQHRPIYRSHSVYRPYPVYRQPGQVSTGSAVAGAIAVGAVAGIIGYQLGKNTEKARTQPANCKTVNIDNDQKLVCRDANGNWNVQ